MKKLFFTLVLCITVTAFVSAKDRALLVGVDFYQQTGVPPTAGSVNDAEALQRLLINKFNFAPNSIKILKNQEAATQNILRELDIIIRETNPGDRVFFHYAGHGFQVPDEGILDEADELDEVIAPYNIQVLKKPNGKVNLTLTAGTYISDDVFNDYIVKLAGRSVVMIFDSCHSGTISRSLVSRAKENSRYLRLEEKSRSMGDPNAYSYIPNDEKSRDLSIVKDDNMGDGIINGAVVISAASPYQEAFPIPVGNGLRGALSYSFEQSHSGNNLPRLSDLKSSILNKMRDLERQGILDAGKNGYQVPEIEVYSKTDIWNQPIFGWAIANDDSPIASTTNYSSSLISALTNQFSNINVNLSLRWNGLPDKNHSRQRFADKFYLEDEIEYSVKISEPGYLYVLVFSAENVATCLFPALTENNGKWIGVDTDNYLEKGTHIFPRSPKQFPKVLKDYTPVVMPPFGKDVWVALFSKQPLPIGEKQNYTWSEIFQRIGIDRLQQEVWERTRGVGNKSSTSKLSDTDWQSSIIVVETVR